MQILVHLLESFADQKNLVDPDFDLLLAVFFDIERLGYEADQLAILVLREEA